MLGEIFANLHNHKKAIEFYQRAIRADPKYAAAYSNMALEFSKCGNEERSDSLYEKALRLYNKDLKRNPYNINIMYNKAVVFYNLGRISSSIKVLGGILKLDSDHIDSVRLMAQSLLEKGKITESMGYAHRALGIDPQDGESKAVLEKARSALKGA